MKKLQNIQITSGRELSKYVGFKKVLSDRDKIATLIFDEIDTGISGITNSKLLEKNLQKFQKNHQLRNFSFTTDFSLI